MDEELLNVPISGIVRADFRRRGVFPDLCKEPAKAGRHLVQLTHAQARALIEDLSMADRPAPWPECKGVVLARTALHRNIEGHFQSEQRRAERRRDAEVVVPFVRPCRALRLVPPAPPPVCHETVQALETLLAGARCGQVIGIAFAVAQPDGYFVDVFGDFKERLVFARGAVAALDDKLRELVQMEEA